MQLLGAWWRFGFRENHWAFFVPAFTALLLAFGCNNGNKSGRSLSDEEMCHIDADTRMDDEFGRAAYSCNGNSNPNNLPVLYAHYLEKKTAREEMCVDEALEVLTGAINCAPGPVALEHGNSVDSGERDWILTALPDYFAWHLAGRTSVDESIYIANASGLPVKAQTIKLEHDNDSTLVLFPKTMLSPGTRYYIYLVRTTADSKTQRWIQPIMMSASTDEGNAAN